MSAPPLPPALAAALSLDSDAVRPLLSPGRRTLVVAGVASLSAVALIATSGVHADHAPSLPLLTAAVVVPLTLGAALIHVAMREGVPSEGVSAPTRRLAVTLGIAALLLLPLLQTTIGVTSHPFQAADSLCYWLVMMVAAPVSALLFFLLGRAYPLRSTTALALGSLGAGFIANVAASLLCANANFAHSLFFHAGPVATVTLIGTLLGWALGRRWLQSDEH